MTDKLEFFLLGSPSVRWNGSSVHVQRRLARSLLFYLAWQGAMVQRDTVLDLFWENGIRAARKRLTETLSRLRAALPVKDIIIRHENLIGINRERVYIDRLHFESLINQAGPIPWTTPEDKPLPPEVHHLLLQANALWQDDFALQGVFSPTPTFDHYLQKSTQQLHGVRFNVLTRLCHHASVMADFQAALQFAQTASIYEPYNLKNQFMLFWNLVKLGRIADAKQYFAETQVLLRDDLGISPPPQMVKLYREIQTLDDAPFPEAQPEWNIHPSMNIPFVGRESDLREIGQIMRSNQALILVGESGQGKTRLLQEFLARLTPQPRVLLAICHPLESTLPFHPLAEMLRRHVAPLEWLSLPPVWARHIVGLLPELAQMRDDIQPISLFDGIEQAQAMIFESIRQFFLLLAEQHPIFVVIDDAQWADQATLDAVGYLLAREPFSKASTMAIIVRQEDISDALQKRLNSFQETKHAVVYHLDSLPRNDIRTLAYHLLQEKPSDAFINRLLTDTGGNTFFILEILQAIMGPGKVDMHSPETSLPLTKNSENLILTRIQKVSREARAVLDMAALLGFEFSILVLTKACNKTPETLSPLLSELENNLLIRFHEQQQGDVFYRFIHGKIRETLVHQISAQRAHILRKSIIQAIDHNAQNAALLAHHYSEIGDLVAAFRCWIKTAERARSLYGREDAHQAYTMAENALKQVVAKLGDDEIYHFYTEWSDLTYETGNTSLLQHIGHMLIQIGEARNSALLVGSGLDTLSDACMTKDDFETGLEYTNQAIARLEETGNCFELVETYNHQGTFLYMLNRPKAALRSFQDALALSIDTSDAKIYKARSNAHYHTALLQVLFAKPTIGYEHGQKALEFAELEQ
ncbi:MAG TPA: hypothetical protein EYP88_00715, partial [Anaerolineales bacterium]|nr:hypothetical protein [Anaerolineales bacterium]